MATVIQIKRSNATNTPSGLAAGELAYSFLSGSLFIGDGSSSIKIGGLDSGYVHTTGDETIGGIKTFSNNVIINGDLTVNGTVTHVNSTTVDIGDNILVLNSQETGSPSADAGLEIERGTADNAFMIWNESVDKWGTKIGTGSFTAFSLEGHSHIAADITDFSTAVDARISAASIDALSDVAISSPTNNQFLRYNGSAWVNQSVTLVTAFTQLSDAPSAYTGSGGYFVRVNAGATALEFTNTIDGGSF